MVVRTWQSIGIWIKRQFYVWISNLYCCRKRQYCWQMQCWWYYQWGDNPNDEYLSQIKYKNLKLDCVTIGKMATKPSSYNMFVVQNVSMGMIVLTNQLKICHHIVWSLFYWNKYQNTMIEPFSGSMLNLLLFITRPLHIMANFCG